MPVILKKIPSKAEKFFATMEEQEMAETILAKVRRTVSDNDKLKNVFDLFEYTYSDEDILGFIKDAMDDINSGYPRSAYTIVSLGDPTMIENGAIVRALLAKGMLHVKNSVPINDQGVQINVYDKGPNFQAWAQFYVQEFQTAKQNLKSALHYNNMFVGIPSEISYM